MVMMDIDGLRYDVFSLGLQSGKAPNLGRLLGAGPAFFSPDRDLFCEAACSEALRLPKGLLYAAISTAPSVTYCCQASSFTGAHPRDHWIPGNVFFDRFGRINGGVPRKYEFDFVDGPQVFLEGLAGKALNPAARTIYQTAAERGFSSMVAYNMYAEGAQDWLKPGLDDWKAFLALSRAGFGERFDNAMLEDVLRWLRRGRRPDLLTLYFFGLDHESHVLGPGVQSDYLEVIDRQIGRFLQEYERLGLMPDTLFVIFSDHGQYHVINDDAHTLKVGFLFDREMGYLFEALGLDVHDHPLEGPNCDALLAPCGGMAYVYLRRRGGHWRDAPEFEQVLRLAQAFWEANESGKYCCELHGALYMVAVRDVERQGWYADYLAYTPGGLKPIREYLAEHPEIKTVDAENRLHYLSSPLTGDLLLFADWEHGYSFNLVPYIGTHGSLHPSDSTAILAYGLPGGTPQQVGEVQEALEAALAERCRQEGQRLVGNVDLAYSLRALMGW